MEGFKYVDKNGSFVLKNAENTSYLYFPIAGERGLKSSVTPNLGGDAKIDQNTFVLEPVSSENLMNNRNTRNFWVKVDGSGIWSATGNSAWQMADKFTDMQEESEVEAGFMWHKLIRSAKKYDLKSEIIQFVPVDENCEVMMVTISNTGDKDIKIVPTAAIPLYGRSADNIRDHRHVTSLLHRIKTTEYGVEVKPTLSFDERGHQINHMIYYTYGWNEAGKAPCDFYPVAEDYIGEGGSFTHPYAVISNEKGVAAGENLAGLEAVGGLHFEETTLKKGEEKTFIILTGVDKDNKQSELYNRFNSKEKVEKELDEIKKYWQEKVNVSYGTGDSDFNNFMKWISFQPILRRIYGCSFLPHHDYGKGGRGWRDLWQDCLALLIMNPDGVRQMLLDNFEGVRVDGSNATIIGSKQGEFVADRNNITRVWMDHGVWPFMTTKFYIDQSGDVELLDKNVGYFKDKQVKRGTAKDDLWGEDYGSRQKTEAGEVFKGSILEHLLIQNLTSFYEVGEHNNILIRGADWNDAIDMADEKGESVAFTNAYAGNLIDISKLLKVYENKTGNKEVPLMKELLVLLKDDASVYDSVEKKKEVLGRYLDTCWHNISGEKVMVSVEELSDSLKAKGEWIREHIRKTEWVTDGKEYGWFNGYYDNNSRQVEGAFENGVRMMLTSQVFSIMGGTATDDQIKEIVKSADKYLYKEKAGGYRLNTDFKEIKTDLGRMFGFSYGDKENGAVFSHMAVMYANSLYKRGFVKEGMKALFALYNQTADFEISRIYPGIPEYFNARGRGMYHYLTGAASWFMLTVITEMYGVRGENGALLCDPKLVKEQFDADGKATLSLYFAGKKWNITYVNEKGLDYGEYKVSEIMLDGKEIAKTDGKALVSLDVINTLDTDKEHEVIVKLN